MSRSMRPNGTVICSSPPLHIIRRYTPALRKFSLRSSAINGYILLAWSLCLGLDKTRREATMTARRRSSLLRTLGPSSRRFVGS